MRLFLILFSTLIAVPAPAAADIRARYTGDGGPALIEVDDNGDSRLGGESGESYSLFTAAGDYVVFRQGDELVAARYEDFNATLKAVTGALGGPVDPKAELPPGRPAVSPLVEAGKEKIAGYEGTRFEWAESDGQAYAILSDAPELRPLGRAMARLLDLMPTFGETLGGEKPPAIVALADMLGSTALLKLGEIFALTDVSFEPLPRERFRLPAKLMTREQVAAMLRPGKPVGE